MPHPYPYPWNGPEWRDPLKLPPGMLRDELVIEQPSATPGPDGASVTPDSWTPVIDCMGKIDTISTRDSYSSGQLASQLSHVVWMGWTDTPIKAGYRILFQSTPSMPARWFLIQAVENVQERNRVLTLRCLEVDAGQ